MTNKQDGGPAFPFAATDPSNVVLQASGMSLRDWFAGQALANQTICTGKAENYEINRWFGPHRTGITRAEIVAKQAGEYADAMLEDRK